MKDVCFQRMIENHDQQSREHIIHGTCDPINAFFDDLLRKTHDKKKNRRCFKKNLIPFHLRIFICDFRSGGNKRKGNNHERIENSKQFFSEKKNDFIQNMHDRPSIDGFIMVNVHRNKLGKTVF
ncbi:hypothetical protein SDC9_146081 [bioreactor metagenome]|uniref:Uncharacterized protein n=1 Tax=bioreactor metagenome TaxID=1076179 RepID=A0A645EC29_9ZZZZ